MIRLIKKFRGRTPLGETLYGDYMSPAIRRKRSGEIEESRFAKILVGKEWRLVPDDSVKQLVCYDQYGKQVYEDDTVVDKDGKTWTAKLVCELESDDGDCVIVTDSSYKNFTLKECS